MRIKRLTLAVAVLATAATLQAQTYNDTVRTHTWSVYIQGGGTLYHGMRGMDEIAKRKHIMPFGGVGVKYNIKPWVRLGLNLEYDMLRSLDKGMLSTTTNKDYEIKDPSTGKTYPTTLETKMDRFQNRYTMQYAMADLNVDFNIMEFWHNRKAQQLNPKSQRMRFLGPPYSSPQTCSDTKYEWNTQTLPYLHYFFFAKDKARAYSKMGYFSTSLLTYKHFLLKDCFYYFICPYNQIINLFCSWFLFLIMIT